MDGFLDKYNIPKLGQEQVDSLNSTISYKEIEVTKNFPTKNSPGPDRFSAEFYQTYQEDLIPFFLKLFHKIEREGTLSNLFYEAIITVLPKLHKYKTKEENFRQTWLMNINEKVLNKILSN